MKVVIDARYVGETLHGFARYVLHMAKGLSELNLSYEPIFLVQNGFASRFHGFKTLEVSAPFLHPSELIEIPRLLKSTRADLYHSPTFSSLAYCPCPWVMTIHDLNHLTYGGVKEKIYYQLLLKRFARNAQKILTVSNFSRGEIAQWLGKDKSEIGLVYNAIDRSLAEPISEAEVNQVLAHFKLERGKYFFCLSNPKPHKNVALLVEAFEKFRAKESGVQLVLSMDGFSERAGVRALGGLSELQTKALLAGAKALFFPSLYEGFGLPPVEAAVMGVPIVVSQIVAHQEALQDLALTDARWVQPEHLNGWVEAMMLVQSGGLASVPSSVREKILTRYAVSRLGVEMDTVFRQILG